MKKLKKILLTGLRKLEIRKKWKGHLEKALKGSWVEVYGLDNDTLDEEVKENEVELRNLYELCWTNKNEYTFLE